MKKPPRGICASHGKWLLRPKAAPPGASATRNQPPQGGVAALRGNPPKGGPQRSSAPLHPSPNPLPALRPVPPPIRVVERERARRVADKYIGRDGVLK